MSTTEDILHFYWHLYNQLLNIKYASNLETLIYWDLNFTNNTNFQSLEVVDRGSKTQLQVDKSLNFLAQCSQGLLSHYLLCARAVLLFTACILSKQCCPHSVCKTFKPTFCIAENRFCQLCYNRMLFTNNINIL